MDMKNSRAASVLFALVLAFCFTPKVRSQAAAGAAKPVP